MLRLNIRCAVIELLTVPGADEPPAAREIDWASDPYLRLFLTRRFGGRIFAARNEAPPPLREMTFEPPGQRDDWLRREERPESSP